MKAAAFGALIRLLGTAFSSPLMVFDFTGWASALSVLAALTMTLGNLAAIRQDNIKRMLAYSSIAHAGYLLIGVVASGLGVADAKPAVLFYLLAYTFTTLGVFGVVAWIGNRNDERLYIDDWAGVGAARPAVALAMTLFLLSLGGIPPAGGFFAKFYLFRAAMQAPQLYWLVVVGRPQQPGERLLLPARRRGDVLPRRRPPVLPHRRRPSMRAGLLLAALAGRSSWAIFPSSFVDWAGSLGLK